MDAKDFRRFGYQFIDWVADYREGLARLPVMSQVQPGDPGRRFRRIRLERAAGWMRRWPRASTGMFCPASPTGTTPASSPISRAIRATPPFWPTS